MSAPRPDPGQLLEQNVEWRNEILEQDPEFFINLAKGQIPKVPFNCLGYDHDHLIYPSHIDNRYCGLAVPIHVAQKRRFVVVNQATSSPLGI